MGVDLHEGPRPHPQLAAHHLSLTLADRRSRRRPYNALTTETHRSPWSTTPSGPLAGNVRPHLDAGLSRPASTFTDRWIEA
jgi:hypothetical protein